MSESVSAAIYNDNDVGEPMTIDFLYWEECPSHAEVYERLSAVLAEEGVQAEIRRLEVSTDQRAGELGFPGSPTIRIGGQDIQPEAIAEARPSLTCRLYILEDGRPSPLPWREMIRRAVGAQQKGRRGRPILKSS